MYQTNILTVFQQEKPENKKSRTSLVIDSIYNSYYKGIAFVSYQFRVWVIRLREDTFQTSVRN